MSSRCLWRILSATSAISICTATLPVLAQELRLDTIVVSPNRAPTKVSETGSSVTVIDEETIEEQSMPLVLDYLATVPGVSIATPGGAGTETSLSLRGAPRRYVKTLYNGIDIADVTAPQVQTSYQYLLTGGVASMEVLRGSQSTLYGSDAIAGVISVNTLGDVQPGITHIIGAEGGSFGTATANYGLRAANGAGKFAANIVGFHTDGISAAAAGTERDGYQNLTGDFNGEYRFNDAFSVFASGFVIDAEAEFDDDLSSPPRDDITGGNLNRNRQIAGRAGFDLNLLDGRLKNTFSVQGLKLDRKLHSVSGFGPYNADYTGRRTKFDFQGSFEATNWLTLRYGADHERQNAVFSDDSGSQPTDDRMHDTGIWMQGDLKPVENLFLAAGLRHDHHNRYGGETTYRLSGTYLVDQTGTRLHSSYGTGFRAPSLYELYAPWGVGDQTLQPETSRSFDIGIEQQFLNGALVANLTYFNLTIDNLIINTEDTGWRYVQIDGRSRMSGVEASVSYDVNDQLTLGGAYTYTSAVDQYDVRLPQVARHMMGVTATYKPSEKWTISGTGRVALDTVALDGSTLDNYFLLNAKVAYKPDENKELYVRVENLLDQDYQTVRGFNNPGIGVFAGFRMAFQP